jgi:hypothetical protein
LRKTIDEPIDRPSPSTAQRKPVACGHADQRISSFSSAIAACTCSTGRSTSMLSVHSTTHPR